MGGRGGSSGGGIKGIVINTGNTVLSFREYKGHITDINKSDVKNTNGLSLNQIRDNAKSKGWEVKTYNSKQLREHDTKYKKERSRADKNLNDIYAKARLTARKHRGR